MDLTENTVQVITLDIMKELALLLGPIMLVALIAGLGRELCPGGSDVHDWSRSSQSWKRSIPLKDLNGFFP